MHDMSESELAAFQERVRKSRENENGSNTSFAAKAAKFLLIAGGVTATCAVIVPGTTAGASRTAHLEWQRREAAIDKAAETPSPSAHPGQP